MSLTAALLSLTLWTAAEPPKPHIAGLRVAIEGSRMELGFDLLDAFDTALRERLESGLPTSILYELQLVRERRLWFDRKIARSSLEVTATYDGVTMEYQIHYRLNGELVDSLVVQESADLIRAMTRVRDLAAFGTALPERDDRLVRVRADLGSKTWLSLIPIRITSDWAQVTIRSSG